MSDLLIFQAAQIDEVAEKFERKCMDDIESPDHPAFCFSHGARFGFKLAVDELVVPLRDALEFECGDRCAFQNPCNAKKTIQALEEKLK